MRSDRSGSGAAIFVAIGIVVCIFTGLIAFRFGQEHPVEAPKSTDEDAPTQAVTLSPTNFAKQLGLDGVTLSATLLPQVTATVQLPDGVSLPGGTALEVWLYDLPRGTAGSSASGNDEVFGAAFDNAALDAALDAAPFAKSLGALRGDGKTFTLPAIAAEGTRPYDVMLITLESDRNLGNYDPRPGTPLYLGNL